MRWPDCGRKKVKNVHFAAEFCSFIDYCVVNLKGTRTWFTVKFYGPYAIGNYTHRLLEAALRAHCIMCRAYLWRIRTTFDVYKTSLIRLFIYKYSFMHSQLVSFIRVFKKANVFCRGWNLFFLYFNPAAIWLHMNFYPAATWLHVNFAGSQNGWVSFFLSRNMDSLGAIWFFPFDNSDLPFIIFPSKITKSAPHNVILF